MVLFRWPRAQQKTPQMFYDLKVIRGVGDSLTASVLAHSLLPVGRALPAFLTTCPGLFPPRHLSLSSEIPSTGASGR